MPFPSVVMSFDFGGNGTSGGIENVLTAGYSWQAGDMFLVSATVRGNILTVMSNSMGSWSNTGRQYDANSDLSTIMFWIMLPTAGTTSGVVQIVCQTSTVLVGTFYHVRGANIDQAPTFTHGSVQFADQHSCPAVIPSYNGDHMFVTTRHSPLANAPVGAPPTGYVELQEQVQAGYPAATIETGHRFLSTGSQHNPGNWSSSGTNFYAQRWTMCIHGKLDARIFSNFSFV